MHRSVGSLKARSTRDSALRATGHEARKCPDKPVAGAVTIKTIEHAGVKCVAALMCITDKPRTQQLQLGDFIRAAPAKPTTTRNIFQPLSLSVWQDIAAEVAREQSPESIKMTMLLFLDSSAFPRLCSPVPPDGLFIFSNVPLPPRRQGEICGNVHSSQAKANFNFRGGGNERPCSGYTNALLCIHNTYGIANPLIDIANLSMK